MVVDYRRMIAAIELVSLSFTTTSVGAPGRKRGLPRLEHASTNPLSPGPPSLECYHMEYFTELYESFDAALSGVDPVGERQIDPTRTVAQEPWSRFSPSTAPRLDVLSTKIR